MKRKDAKAQSRDRKTMRSSRVAHLFPFVCFVPFVVKEGINHEPHQNHEKGKDWGWAGADGEFQPRMHADRR